MSSYYYGWGNYRYTSAGDIARKAHEAIEKAKKKGLDYHPVIINGNKIAKTWWGQSWCKNLERYADFYNRLERGRRYAKNGAVIDLKIQKGFVEAKVQGTRLYSVRIVIDPLEKNLEKELGKICSEHIQNVEELLSGKFPSALKDRFFERGVLFPSPREIHFDCSCPDGAYMCKHVAAVMYAIGARLDEEPLGFFDLRGIMVDAFIAKAVKNRVESMLSNAGKKSSRVIDDADILNLFGMEVESTDISSLANGDGDEVGEIRSLIRSNGYSNKIERNSIKLLDYFALEAFSRDDVVGLLLCTDATAMNYIRRLKDAGLVESFTDGNEVCFRFISRAR